MDVDGGILRTQMTAIHAGITGGRCWAMTCPRPTEFRRGETGVCRFEASADLAKEIMAAAEPSDGEEAKPNPLTSA
jgi:hypothetical protein